MKWVLLVLCFIGPGNLMIISKDQVKRSSKNQFTKPLVDLKQPLDSLSFKLEELSTSLEKL